ncbi:hypothetical protein SADUNF_Sadunf06G0010000 [Salix dunnii]|uniref:Uncharacterized protein n=1 Tax=Salix dunnii TaxID=1413687 RepID=A0A835N2K5_9ROSI|nr:hypothetical protein SADUNF_Sadunf06G0010000 [Salix dunnii]
MFHLHIIPPIMNLVSALFSFDKYRYKIKGMEDRQKNNARGLDDQPEFCSNTCAIKLGFIESDGEYRAGGFPLFFLAASSSTALSPMSADTPNSSSPVAFPSNRPNSSSPVALPVALPSNRPALPLASSSPPTTSWQTQASWTASWPPEKTNGFKMIGLSFKSYVRLVTAKQSPQLVARVLSTVSHS